MSNRDELMELFEKEYLSKIFGFSVMKTNSRADAEDLSQEIAYQMIRAIDAGKKIENFSTFIWSVSNHTFYHFLRKKKRTGAAYLPETIVSEENIEAEYILRERLGYLRRELALISQTYRQALVMFYFNGKSCEEIAAKTGSTIGTVKWWLHEGRKRIKEGMDTMREYGEKSYNPGRLLMSCQGTPGLYNEPMSCARSKSTQNILLAAYQNPMRIEDLCMELGIPAAYIEDDVAYLKNNQLLKEVSAGKYQTDFVILPGNNTSMAVHIYQSCFPAYYDALISHLNQYKDTFLAPKNNIVGFTWERLLWVYIHMVTDIAANRFRDEVCHIIHYHDMPDRPQGGKWIALGYHNSYDSDSEATDSEWKEYVPFDGPVHKPGSEFVQGYYHYWSGLDSNVFFHLPDGIFELCRKIIKGELHSETLHDEQKYLFSVAIENNLFVQKDGGLIPNYFFIGREGRRMVETVALEFYDTALPFFNRAWEMVLSEYQSTVPGRLHFQMANFLSNHLSRFVPCSLYVALNNGDISVPEGKGKAWLSLFASEP